jgi:c-di-AMP phosphodiesterase-like protein
MTVFMMMVMAVLVTVMTFFSMCRIMLVIMVMIFMVMFLMFIFISLTFLKFLAPAGRRINRIKIKASGSKNFSNRNISVGSLDNLYSRMKGFNNLADLFKIIFRYKILLINNEG